MVSRSYFGLGRLVGSVALVAVLVGGPLSVVACAGREWGHSPPPLSVDSVAPVPSGTGSASPFISARADAICGDSWKWNGARCTQAEPVAADDPALVSKPSTRKPARGPSTVASQLLMTDIKPGDGKEARRGDTVRVHYVGTLPDGTEFDSSRRRDTPLEFQLGTGAVIKGFDTAIVGMKVGGVRRATIPPELGYGAKGSPPRIPPNATLIFEVELVDVLTD